MDFIAFEQVLLGDSPEGSFMEAAIAKLAAAQAARAQGAAK